MPNFKSQADYKKWLVYGHASGAFDKKPGNQPVSVAGKKVDVKHTASKPSPTKKKRLK